MSWRRWQGVERQSSSRVASAMPASVGSAVFRLFAAALPSRKTLSSMAASELYVVFACRCAVMSALSRSVMDALSRSVMLLAWRARSGSPRMSARSRFASRVTCSRSCS